MVPKTAHGTEREVQSRAGQSPPGPAGPAVPQATAGLSNRNDSVTHHTTGAASPAGLERTEEEKIRATALCDPCGSADPQCRHGVTSPCIPQPCRYLAAPAATPAACPGPAHSRRPPIAGSASAPPPRPAALPGPARSKRQRGTCSGHPGTGKETQSLQHLLQSLLLWPSICIFPWREAGSLVLLLPIPFQLNSLISLQHLGLWQGNKRAAGSAEHPSCLRGQS